ncbi:MAG: CPBP family intramembrane metalloprotease, partial [Chloroflexi bacterium]|nr:CPBP family intramembrane metalloprotease [Chloroflexota bacterium]
MERATQAVSATSQRVPWTGRDLAQAILLVIGIATLGLVLLFLPLSLQRGGDLSRVRGLLALALTGSVEGGLLAALWLFALRRHHATWRQIGFRTLPLMAALRPVPVTILFAFAGLAAYSILVQSLGLSVLRPSGVPSIFLQDPVLLGALTGLGAVAAPLTEEAFFRGFAFTALQPRWGTGKAALLSSLLFGLAHASPGLILPITVLGLALAYLFWRTGSLWSCVL